MSLKKMYKEVRMYLVFNKFGEFKKGLKQFCIDIVLPVIAGIALAVVLTK